MTSVPRGSRRALFLGLLGTLHVAYGTIILTARTAVPLNAYRLLIPLPLWGVIWVVTGIGCLAAAWRKQNRWAFTVASCLHAGWLSQFVYVWLTQGYPNALSAVCVWGWVTGVVLVVSSWPDPPPTAGGAV